MCGWSHSETQSGQWESYGGTVVLSFLLYTCSSPTVNHDVLPFNIVSSNSLDHPAWTACIAKRQPRRWQKLPSGKVVFEVPFFYDVSRQERVEFRTYTATTHQLLNGIFLPMTFCFDVVHLYKPSSVFPLMSFTKVIYDFNTHPLTFLVHRHQLMMTLNLLVSVHVQFMQQNAAPFSVHTFFWWILSNQSLAELMKKTSFAFTGISDGLTHLQTEMEHRGAFDFKGPLSALHLNHIRLNFGCCYLVVQSGLNLRANLYKIKINKALHQITWNTTCATASGTAEASSVRLSSLKCCKHKNMHSSWTFPWEWIEHQSAHPLLFKSKWLQATSLLSECFFYTFFSRYLGRNLALLSPHIQTAVADSDLYAAQRPDSQVCDAALPLPPHCFPCVAKKDPSSIFCQ